MMHFWSVLARRQLELKSSGQAQATRGTNEYEAIVLGQLQQTLGIEFFKPERQFWRAGNDIARTERTQQCQGFFRQRFELERNRRAVPRLVP